MNLRELIVRKNDAGNESFTGPLSMIIFIGLIGAFFYWAFKSTSENAGFIDEGGSASVNQIAEATTQYSNVKIESNEEASSLGSIRGLQDETVKPTVKVDKRPRNVIIDSINSEKRQFYGDLSNGDDRFEAGSNSDQNNSIFGLFDSNNSGIELNESLDLLLAAAGYQKVDTGKYENSQRTIYPQDYRDLNDLLNQLGFYQHDESRFINNIGLLIDFNRADFKGGTLVKGLYQVNLSNGEYIARETIKSKAAGQLTINGEPILNIDDHSIITDQNGRLANIQSDADIVTPSGENYVVRRSTLKITRPKKEKTQENNGIEPLVFYGVPLETEAEKNAEATRKDPFAEGNYLPKGFKIPVVLLNTIRSDINDPMILFSAVNDVTAFGKIQIPKGTRFIASMAANSAGTSPSGDRIPFKISAVLYPDGSETALKGTVLGIDRQVGIKGYYIPLPLYVQTYPVMTEMAIAMLSQWANQGSQIEEITANTLGQVTGFSLAEDDEYDPRAAAIEASISSIRKMANQHVDALYSRHAPHVKIPHLEPAYIMVMQNTDLSQSSIKERAESEPTIDPEVLMQLAKQLSQPSDEASLTQNLAQEVIRRGEEAIKSAIQNGEINLSDVVPNTINSNQLF